MTQQTLAERAKLSVEAIGTLERGARTRPYRETVALLARALDLSPDREALLESSIDIVQRPRRRERVDALKPSLLRIVRPDAEVRPGHNLPKQLTSFVGRQRDVSEIAALLQQQQLATVTGAGGVGKTRVAMWTGAELLGNYPDGVMLVDLAPLADQTMVATAILNVLQLPSSTGPGSEAVVAYLKTRKLLLILDNCEHVIAEAREIAANIVRTRPAVRVLATSREPLRVPGEQIYRLPSLAVPQDSCRNLRGASRYEAVALFVDRASAVDAGFALTEDNAPAVAEICRRLDGIPLAIELAAARVNVLSPGQIAQRLDQRFRLLTGGDLRALPRHQTMTALIDWSYDLLTPREQGLYESLAVFADGCALDAATAVCARDDEDDIEVVDLLASLVAKSLVIAELVGSEQRYRLPESSRQYAWGKLIARGEVEALARRHAVFYVKLAERLQSEWDKMPDRAWLPRAAVELRNWRMVFERTLAKRSNVILGQRLAAVQAVMLRGFTLAEGRWWIRKALELVDDSTPPRLIAQLEHSEAEGARRSADFKVALDAAERAWSRYRELGDVRQIAETQSLVGSMYAVLARPSEAEPLLREALKMADTIGDIRLRAYCLQRLGRAIAWLGDLTGSCVYFTEAHGLAKILGATVLGAGLGVDLAGNSYRGGDAETALRLIGDVIAEFRSLNAPSTATNIVYCLSDEATYLIALGRYDQARAVANEALALARSLQLAFMVSRSLQHLAIVALLRHQVDLTAVAMDHAGAARILGFVEDRLTAMGVGSDELDHEVYQRGRAVLAEALAAGELAHMMAIGATMTEDEAIAQAHALE
jgi:predicted ATPase